MPRGRWTVAPVESDRLRIAVVQRVVVTAVCEIDSPDEGHVAVTVAAVADDEQFLVVASAPSDPLVNEHLPTRLVDAVGKAQVLLLAEACLVRV